MENKNCLVGAGSIVCGLVSISLAAFKPETNYLVVSICFAIAAGVCVYYLVQQYTQEKEVKKQQWADVGDLLKLQLQHIQNIEKDITITQRVIKDETQKVNGDLQAYNQKQLAGFNDVLAQLQKVPDTMQQAIATISHNTAQQVMDMQRESTKQYSLSVKNIHQELDALMKEWRKQMYAQLTEVQQTNQKLDEIPANLQEMVKQVENSLDRYAQNTDAAMQAHMESQLAEIKKVTKKLQNISDDMKKSIADGVQSINKTFDQTNTILQSIPAAVKQSHLTVQGELKNQMSGYLDMLQQASDDFDDRNKKIERAINDNMQDMNDSFADTRDSIAEAVEAIKNSETDIGDKVNSLAGQYKEFETFTNALVKQLTDLSEEDRKYWKGFIK